MHIMQLMWSLLPCTAGDARNEVTTGVSKLGFDPAIYRANALQSLVYDPLRMLLMLICLTLQKIRIV